MSKLLCRSRLLSISFLITALTGCSDDVSDLGPIDRSGSPVDTALPRHDHDSPADAGVRDAATVLLPPAHDAAIESDASDLPAQDPHDAGGEDASAANEEDAGPPPVVADGTFASAFSLLSMHCAGCHGAGKALDFSSLESAHAALVNVPASMKACAPSDGGVAWLRVVPGDLEQSLMIQKLEGHAPCGNQMPMKMLLADETVEVFRAWIKAGAPAL